MSTQDLIRFVECWFVTLKGQLRCMIIPTCNKCKTIEELKKDPCLQKGSSIDGSSVGLTKVEKSDLKLKPNPEKIYELPRINSERRVVVMCNIVSRNSNEAFGADNCTILKNAIDKYLNSNGYKMYVKLEPEFFFITKDKKPGDKFGYGEIYPINKDQQVLQEICKEMFKQNIPVKVLHHESGTGQQEIEIDFTEIEKAADYLYLFKNICREVTSRHGKSVTFLPKPFSNTAGSGMHIHMKIFDKDGKNIFGVPGKDNEISEVGKSFIAGLIDHAKGITAIGNPSVNSFKRLVPGFEAPVYISWGYANRTSLIRIPQFGDSQNAAIEFRSPDLMCNPFLLFNGLIAAGIDGILKKKKAPKPEDKNLFDTCGNGLERLPENLGEAISEFEKDELLTESIGTLGTTIFTRLKKKEWEKYLHFVVSEWEWAEYGFM